MPCEKGKGATLYYFAAYETIKWEDKANEN